MHMLASERGDNVEQLTSYIGLDLGESGHRCSAISDDSTEGADALRAVARRSRPWPTI
jgi:hypothetical protein